jgi:hypothetical protein
LRSSHLLRVGHFRSQASSPRAACSARAHRNLRRPACGVGGRRRPRVARVAHARRLRSGPAQACDRRSRARGGTGSARRQRALPEPPPTTGSVQRRRRWGLVNGGAVTRRQVRAPHRRPQVVPNCRLGPTRRVTGTLRRQSSAVIGPACQAAMACRAARRAPALGPGSVSQRRNSGRSGC